MVSSTMNLLRSGLSSWLIQRLSALVLGIYTLCIFGIFIVHPEIDYGTWKAVFDNNLMRVFSIVTLVAACVHGWIGLWTVFTDYLTPRLFAARATAIRKAFQTGGAFLIAVYLFWGIQILWGS